MIGSRRSFAQWTTWTDWIYGPSARLSINGFPELQRSGRVLQNSVQFLLRNWARLGGVTAQEMTNDDKG